MNASHYKNVLCLGGSHLFTIFFYFCAPPSRTSRNIVFCLHVYYMYTRKNNKIRNHWSGTVWVKGRSIHLRAAIRFLAIACLHEFIFVTSTNAIGTLQ